MVSAGDSPWTEGGGVVKGIWVGDNVYHVYVETMRVCPPLIRTTNGQNKVKSGAISPMFLGNWLCRCKLPSHWSVFVYWPLSSTLIGWALRVGLQNLIVYWPYINILTRKACLKDLTLNNQPCIFLAV